jgi:hypothetical protein
MTKEEEQEFRDKVLETIIPITMNMTSEQIKNIIESVETTNPDLPEGFGRMLLEKILVHKYNR